MKELNQEQHVQLLQFMTLMQNCKTEEEIKKLQEQYYNIPQYSFLQAYIPDRNENQSFSSYKTSLIYDMDKYQQDYKFVYGEKAPAYRKKTMPNNKADYTVLNLLDEINECDNIKKYQELLKEKNNFPKVMIKSLSHEFTGIYFADGSSITQEITTISLSIPQIIIKNTPEDNFNARKQLVEAGYSLFNIPSVEDVQENGFDWLHEEITHFKALLNPNFIEQEKQIDQKPELKENEYEEEYDAFIEQMDANGGMSSMAAEADYNAFYEEQEDVDEVQHQMDIDNGLIDENGNEILYDVPEEKQEELSYEEFDSYIHSEGFISKFGDWEKANRLEKLKKSEPLIGSDSIIVEGVDVSDIASRLRASYSIENLKQLQNIARDAGREVIAKLRNEQNIKSPKPPIVINTDSGKEFKVQMTGINEIKNHNIFSKGHIEAISAIPELIKNGIYISSEPNEDGRKPQYTKFHYFAYGYKLDNEDYTAKIVFTETKDGELFYDQSLSAIEKGRLIDIIQKKNMLETVLPHIQGRDSSEQEEVLNPLISQENLNNYDKRLISICQVPQMPYLEKNLVTGQWRPTKEAVEAIKNGTLFVEKQGQKYVMNDSIDKSKENISENISTSVPMENTAPEPQSQITEESQNLNSDQKTAENNNSSYSVSRPKNAQDMHKFFINNPYTPGTPVPKIAMRNELSGHSTFIEGYEFARFEDIGKPNLAFFEEDKKTGKLVRIKPDGQTVVLTKPGFKEEINKETGEKELVIDETKRKFIKISRDLYEQVICNSEIIAKRNPKTEQEHSQMIADYEEAAHLDEKKQRDNTASNFWHNYQAGVMTLANNKQEAMAFAKRLVNEMIPSEREKFANMVRKYENIKGADGKHLSYDQRILDTYEKITKGLTITNKSIWRDHVNDKYNTLDAIKQNTEVFDKEGQSLDKTCRMKIGDTIKISVTVDSALSNKKIKLPPQEYRLVAHSKDNNSVALISADGKQKIIKNREDFIKEVQKIEKKQLKKQQKQDRYESISM
ncbi:hypothetical protein [uncultured Treponema sp.]|uniref:LPD3 domain-containing protein n=1 Tax=uncultured Treponema sp. TaxID=162155 RepID=UPI00259490DC|nr:hypothetical protein [uncultured Treponema sp.]